MIPSSIAHIRVNLDDEVSIYDFLNLLHHGTMDMGRSKALSIFVKVICRSLRDANKVPTYPNEEELFTRISKLTKEYVMPSASLSGAEEHFEANSERVEKEENELLISPSHIQRQKEVKEKMKSFYSEVEDEIKKVKESSLLTALSDFNEKEEETNIVRISPNNTPWNDQDMLSEDDLIKIAQDNSQMRAVSDLIGPEPTELRVYAVRTALKNLSPSSWHRPATMEIVNSTEQIFLNYVKRQTC